ncbi:YdcF family protein [Microseira sp. BLCC-F43]|uniref:YdcF family protein n=1 Tax=Microseira sp. BLCC-F43 TaxID=3153602 RepID=UPI0035BAEA44
MIETSSRTTHQNLKNAKIVASDRQLTKFLIVSDPLHMKRSVLMARDLGLNAYPSPTPTTRYRSLNGQLGFLARETYFYFVYLIFGI